MTGQYITGRDANTSSIAEQLVACWYADYPLDTPHEAQSDVKTYTYANERNPRELKKHGTATGLASATMASGAVGEQNPSVEQQS